jgi:hypothetical protein
MTIIAKISKGKVASIHRAAESLNSRKLGWQRMFLRTLETRNSQDAPL